MSDSLGMLTPGKKSFFKRMEPQGYEGYQK